jgi:hypothetical protein
MDDDDLRAIAAPSVHVAICAVNEFADVVRGLVLPSAG